MKGNHHFSLKWTIFTLTAIQLLSRIIIIGKDRDETPDHSLQAPVSQFHISFIQLATDNRHVSKRYCMYMNSKTKVSLLLLIAGDINPNPGPEYKLKYPCKVCDKAARWGQECLECDNCKTWFHIQCLDMNQSIYNVLANHSSYSWICCDCGMPNLHSSFFDIDSIKTKNSFDSLSNISSVNSNCVHSLPLNDNIGTPLRASSPSKDSKSAPMTQKLKAKDHKLKIININCQSVRAKLASFLEIIDVEDPDIVVGTESWLNSNITSGEIFPSNFNVFRKDRSINGDSHGGVFVAVNDKLIAQDESDLDQPNCEMKWISIHVKGIAPMFIGAFYRSQKTDNDYLRLLDDSLQKIPKNASIWLLGDFNLPDVNWLSNCFTPCGRYPGPSKLMIDIALDHVLKQVVTEPTRDHNILDLCFTNDPSFVDNIKVSAGISDHDAVVVTAAVKAKLVHKPKRKVFVYAKGDYDKIRNDLNSFNNELTDDYVDKCDINVIWSSFTNIVHKSMDAHIPSKMSSCKVKLPWMTDKMRKKCNKKRKQYDKARRSGDFEQWDKFKETRRKIDKDLRKLRRKYISGICDTLQTNNTKPFWRFVKSIRREVFGVGPLQTMGRIVSGAKEKAEALNSQFCSVFTNEDSLNIPQMDISSTPDMPDIKVTTHGVEDLLKNLKVHKATGPDNVPARILKECSTAVAPILQKLFQKSLNSGTVPDDWRKANVSPVFKKGDRTLPSNYRPVSLTSIICKQLEHIIVSNIHKHFDRYSLLSDRQHGFRRGRSCETQLAGLADDLAKILDKRGLVDMCIMDFSKAFDVVPHQRLLIKLDHLGIRHNINRWIGSFLSNRSQNVIIDGKSSSSSPVVSGVPQGTVLGPLLFLAFINDLPECVKSYIRLFADDLILYKQIFSTSDCIALQEDINSLCAWESTWQMSFNKSKCFIMRMTHKKKFSQHQYYMGDSVLQEVKHHPYLGVELSNDFSWAKHITQTTNSSNKILGLIKRNFWNCSPSAKETAYKTLVRPKLEYASSVWDPYHKTYIESLEKVQRRAARFIKNDYQRSSSVTNMLKELKWDTLEDRRTKTRLVTIYKETHGIIPSNIHHLKADQSKPTTRSTHILNYKVPQSQKDCYRFSLYPRTIPQWNSLPPELKTAPDTHSFKLLLNSAE